MSDAAPGALWRDSDPEVFRATLVTAAEQLDVQPLAVEKDYWVCEGGESYTDEQSLSVT